MRTVEGDLALVGEPLPGDLDDDDLGAERLLKAYQVAELLGVSMRTVIDRFDRGDLPGFRLWGRKGGPLRFRLSEIESVLESWRVGGGKDE